MFQAHCPLELARVGRRRADERRQALREVVLAAVRELELGRAFTPGPLTAILWEYPIAVYP